MTGQASPHPMVTTTSAWERPALWMQTKSARGSIGSGNQGEGGASDRRHVVTEAVERPDPLLVAGHEAGVAQPGQGVAHRRLAEVEGGGEVADADGLAGRLENVEHLHPRRIRERAVDGRQVVDDVIRKKGGEGDAAPLHSGRCRDGDGAGRGHDPQFTY